MFNYNERQAKFIVNSVRVYEFFGFRWQITVGCRVDRFLPEGVIDVGAQAGAISGLRSEKTARGAFEFLQDLECTTDLKANNKDGTRNELILDLKYFLSKIPLLENLGKKSIPSGEFTLHTIPIPLPGMVSYQETVS